MLVKNATPSRVYWNNWQESASLYAFNTLSYSLMLVFHHIKTLQDVLFLILLAFYILLSCPFFFRLVLHH